MGSNPTLSAAVFAAIKVLFFLGFYLAVGVASPTAFPTLALD